MSSCPWQEFLFENAPQVSSSALLILTYMCAHVRHVCGQSTYIFTHMPTCARHGVVTGEMQSMKKTNTILALTELITSRGRGIIIALTII